MEWAESLTTTSTTDKVVERCDTITTYTLFQPMHVPIKKDRIIKDDSSYQIDPVALHNIELLKYINRVETLSKNIKENEVAGKNTAELMPVVNAPPTIEHAPSNKQPFTSLKLDFLQSKFFQGTFSNDQELVDHEMPTNTCLRKIMEKSISILCVNEGFGGCTQSVLDLLVDLLHNFFRKILSQLALIVSTNQDEYITGSVKERNLILLLKVLVDSGVGTFSDLIQYRNVHFVEHNQRLVKLSERAYKEYHEKKMMFVSRTPASFLSDYANEPERPAGAPVVKDGWSRKRVFDNSETTTEENTFTGFYGHTEAISDSSPVLAKKMKL